MSKQKPEWEKEFDRKWITEAFDNKGFLVFPHAGLKGKTFISKERVKQFIKKQRQEAVKEVLDEVESRLTRYRCGKHWLLFRLLSQLKKKYLNG